VTEAGVNGVLKSGRPAAADPAHRLCFGFVDHFLVCHLVCPYPYLQYTTVYYRCQAPEAIILIYFSETKLGTFPLDKAGIGKAVQRHLAAFFCPQICHHFIVEYSKL
jgi:hypothetical protein